MNIAVLGGAGAMGGLFGALLAGDNVVTLVDVAREPVDKLNAHGLTVQAKTGEERTVKVRATTSPAEVGHVDLVIVFVKCYHTESALRSAAPMIGPNTTVLSLQNGWGNAPRIAAIIGEEKLLVGVTYHSGTLSAPGRVLHAGQGITFMGELHGAMTERLGRIAEAFTAAGIETTTTPTVLTEIWSKLALNVCTLPTSALLRFYAGQLVEHDGTLALMRSLLNEAVQVANAQDIPLDFDERWAAITALLERAKTGKSSMLQDVEKSRHTEISVINGAIVDVGKRFGIATPYNEAMVWLISSLEATF